MQKPWPYKLVVVGEEGAGKSSLTLRFMTDKFVADYGPHVEDEFHKLCAIDDETVSVRIVDTANLDYYYSYGVFHSHQGEGFVLAYSITSRSSFETVQRFWELIMKACPPMRRDPAFFIVVGNKADLELNREVSAEEGRDFANRVGCDFIETSALQGINIEKVFHDLVHLIRDDDKLIGNDRIAAQKKYSSGCFSSCVVI